MTRYIYLAISLLISFNLSGQLILEKNFGLEDIRYFYVADDEGVYANYSSYSDNKILYLYNDDQQLIRKIDFLEDTVLNVINVSRYLYNDDDLFEIIYTYHTFKNGASHYSTHIINESSRLLENLDDQYLWIQNTPNGVRLLTQQGSRVYSLPGTFYPVSKGERGDPGSTGPQGPQGPQGEKGEKGDPYEEVYNAECDCQLNSLNLPLNESILLAEPYPNPAYISSIVDYDLSSVTSDAYLVVFDVNGTKRLSLHLQPPRGSVEIHKSLLGTGTYFCRIEYESGCSIIRKLVFE